MAETRFSLQRLERYTSPSLAREIAALQQLKSMRLAPIVVVPAATEEHFYRLNNLPKQLAEIFASVNLKNPDEDDIEELTPVAERLIKMHYLLDEVIDQFYEGCAGLPPLLHLRRPEQTGLEALQGRPALMTLRNLWLADWSFESVLKRLEQTQTIGLEAGPILIHPAGDEPAPQHLSREASHILGQKVAAWHHPDYGLTRLAFD